jgi:hypothetical protein
MDSLLDWVKTQQHEWTLDETNSFITELLALKDHCVIMEGEFESSLPKGAASYHELLQKIKNKHAHCLIQADRISILVPNVVVYHVRFPEKVIEYPQPQVVEVEEPVEVEESEDVDLVRQGEHYLIKGTRVVVDIERFVVLGYLNESEVVHEQNQEVIEVCKRYQLQFE